MDAVTTVIVGLAAIPLLGLMGVKALPIIAILLITFIYLD
tara:strand:- start:1526 stop:1645 length:120 start_codon:yes stop_codon:yes gene_type:complete